MERGRKQVKLEGAGTAMRLGALMAIGLIMSGCASVKPFKPRANYPISLPKSAQSTPGTPSAPGAQPSLGDQALGKYKIGNPYQIDGVWYVPAEQPNYDEVGLASWYGDEFHAKQTANGELFDMNAFTAAHKTLPMPSIVEVTNLENGQKMQLRVNDRGPFVGDRIIDLSRAAASALGFGTKGLTKVRVRYVGPAKLLGQSDLASGDVGPPKMDMNAKADINPSVSANDNDLTTNPLGSAPPIPVPSVPLAAPVVAPAIASAALPALPSMGASSPSPAPAPAPSLSADVQPRPQVSQPSMTQPSAQVSAGAYQVVVGAFASLTSAQNLVQQLAGFGQPGLVPIDRNGQTLYRVVVTGLANEAQAAMVQQRAVSLGLTDARLVRP